MALPGTRSRNLWRMDGSPQPGAIHAPCEAKTLPLGKQATFRLSKAGTHGSPPFLRFVRGGRTCAARRDMVH